MDDPLVVILPKHFEAQFRWWLDEHGLEMVQVSVHTEERDELEWLVRPAMVPLMPDA